MVARLLLDHGVDVNVEAVNNIGHTALMLACDNGHEAVARLLLDHMHGANIEAVTNIGHTALTDVRVQERSRVVARLLLDHMHGADVEAVDNHGGTALYYASLQRVRCCVTIATKCTPMLY